MSAVVGTACDHPGRQRCTSRPKCRAQQYSRIAARLTDLTKAKQPNKITLNDEAFDAFNQLKQALYYVRHPSSNCLPPLNRLSYAQTPPTLVSEQCYFKSVTECCSLSHLRERS